MFTDGQTDGQKEKSITIYLAVHSVHLADIINATTNIYFILAYTCGWLKAVWCDIIYKWSQRARNEKIHEQVLNWIL